MATEPTDLTLILALFAGLGAIMGSFANMVIYRLPRAQEMWRTGSHCTSCQKRLGLLQLIPILSYLCQRGKCHACAAKISSRYMWVEVIMAGLFALIIALHGMTPLAYTLCAIALVLVILTAIDLEHMIIPDSLQIALALLAIPYLWYTQSSWMTAVMLSIVGVLFGLGLRVLMFVWKKREGLGWGDVKFLGVAGLFLQWPALAPFCFLSGLAGIITGPVLRNKETSEFPFGPSLAIALFLLLLMPDFIHSQFDQVVDFLVEFMVVKADN